MSLGLRKSKWVESALGSCALGMMFLACGGDERATSTLISVQNLGVDAAMPVHAGAAGAAAAHSGTPDVASQQSSAGAASPPVAKQLSPVPNPSPQPCANRVPLSGGALHQATVEVFDRTCTFAPCHAMDRKQAGVDLSVQSNLRVLVGRAACEAPALPVVDGRGGDTALANSWLWLKLTAPFDANYHLLPNASWGTPGMCGQSDDYGMHMPVAASEALPTEELDIIRSWICSGAPGP